MRDLLSRMRFLMWKAIPCQLVGHSYIPVTQYAPPGVYPRSWSVDVCLRCGKASKQLASGQRMSPLLGSLDDTHAADDSHRSEP